MAEDLVLEILDQNWTRKTITNKVIKCRITEELGQVGDADVEIPIDDPAVAYLPNPDAANPYEGRFRVYEDNTIVFAGVIDAHSKRIDSDSATVSFNGKGRGIILGFYNTGRVDYLGWFLPELLRELTRNNIAPQATLEDVTSEDELYGAFQMVTGDPFKQNYWKTATAVPHTATFDLGDDKLVSAIRVMPQWWKDIDTKKFHFHRYTIQTSPDNSAWTTVGTKSSNNPSSNKGELYTVNDTIRYFRLNVTGSTDGLARIAQIMVYENIANIDSANYTVPFVENDDSGTCSVSGSGAVRKIMPGSFQGDDVITRSGVTLLTDGGHIQHRFVGISDAVYFTSHNRGSSTADIYVDGDFKKNITIPNHRYWFKGYDTAEELGFLSDTVHTLKVVQTSGNVQVDYFNGIYRYSWRPIEADDPSIAYLGSWDEVQASYFYNFFAAQSNSVNNEMHYKFIGDRIRLLGSKASGFGSFEWFLDGASQGTVNCDNGGNQTNRQELLDTGYISGGSHSLSITHTGAGKLLFDRIEGDFAHTLYMRARYEPNLKVLIRMSEIIDSWLRFDFDGSVDLLGSVGSSSGTVVREGENEGGTIITANVENDYSETGSAVLAIVSVNGELPIKAMVIDKEAVAEIGWKLIKLEQADAADQFLLNRQALQYLREKRKPTRSYNVSYDPDLLPGDIDIGETTLLYSPTLQLDGETRHRVGRMVTEYSND